MMPKSPIIFFLNFTQMNVPMGASYNIRLHGGFLQNSYWRVTLYEYDGNFHSYIHIINNAYHAWKVLQNLRFQGINFPLIHQPFSHQGRDHKNSHGSEFSTIKSSNTSVFFPFWFFNLRPSSFNFELFTLFSFQENKMKKWKVNKYLTTNNWQSNRNKVSQYCTSFVISTLPQHEIQNGNS